MLEQEVASIARYVLNKTGLEHYYTDILPETFVYPSVYFPAPELDTEYDTLSTYSVYYRMPVRFFAADNQSAYRLALTAANHLISERNRIPLINPDGTESGKYFKVKKSDVKNIDIGVYGLNVEWESIRTFDDIPEEQEKGEAQVHVSLR